MLDFDQYLAQHAGAVESFLDRNLPAEDALPPSIHRAIRYSLFAGGKRLRPVLALASAEAGRGSGGGCASCGGGARDDPHLLTHP